MQLQMQTRRVAADAAKTCSCRCSQYEQLQMQPRRAAADAAKTSICRCNQEVQLQMQPRRAAADATKTFNRCNLDVQLFKRCNRCNATADAKCIFTSISLHSAVSRSMGVQ